MSEETAAPECLSPPQFSVLVVEDNAEVRAEFIGMLAADPAARLHAAAADLAEARRQIAALGAPDVVLVDLGLPDGEGTELIRELAASAPATRMLVMTVFGDEAHVVRALEAGAHGYLLKDNPADAVLQAIHEVRAGDCPLSPRIAGYLLKRFAPRAAAPLARAAPLEPLTARETQILGLIAQGHTMQDVARQLFLSVHTVGTHVKNIYGKLAVNNRVQAVNRARETGQLRAP